MQKTVANVVIMYSYFISGTAFHTFLLPGKDSFYDGPLNQTML